MKHKLKILFILSTLAGAILWAFSSYIFGASEPWDSPYPGLPTILLLVIGFGFGVVGYEKPLLSPLGIFLGSFLYGLFTFIKDIFFYSGGGANLFIPLGVIFLVPFCIPVLAGSFGGAFLRKKYGNA